MKLNRRSVLGAIGLVGVGTGAAFGSGAFTSTTAERAVEVNVFGAVDADTGTVQNPDQEEQDNTAESITNTAVDVLVDTASDTVTVRDQQDDIVDGTDLFPIADEESDVTLPTGYDELSGSFVSLVANDVTIVFGEPDNNELPPNSRIDYDDLFDFVENQGEDEFNVTFEGDGELLTEIGGDEVSEDAEFTVGDDGPKNGIVETGTESRETENLDIRIEPSG